MQQSWATATAVATGELNAQEAFIKGLIRLTGNQQKLIDSQPVFAALDARVRLRSRTDRVPLRTARARATRGPSPRRAADRSVRRASSWSSSCR